MTPADRARQIDKEEFAAQSAAAVQRALQYAAHRRQEERAAFEATLCREPVKFIPRRWKPQVQPKHELALRDKQPARQPKPAKLPKPKVVRVLKVKPPKSAPDPKRFTVDGLTLTRREWAEHLGIALGAFNTRVSRHGGVEAAIRLEPKRRDFVTIAGERRSVSGWADHLGMAHSTLYRRVQLEGSAEAVIANLMATPPIIIKYSKQADTYTYQGRTLTLREWQTVTGIKAESIRSRIKHGWSIASALTTPPKGAPGVVSNLPASLGTGGGSTAQESPEITFSQKAEIALASSPFRC